MYLSMLSNEKKHLFLNLEINMSRVDGNFSNEEKIIIDAHCIEMHIDNNNYEPDMPIDEVIRQLKETLTMQEKKIVFIELAGTILADNVYNESEKNLVEKYSEILNISSKDADEAFSIINDMKKIYERCAEYVK